MYKFTNFKGVDTDERFRFTGAMCVKQIGRASCRERV